MEFLHVYQPVVVELGWSITLLTVVLCLRLLSCRVDRRIVILLPLMWGSFAATSSILDALTAVRDVGGVHLTNRRDAVLDALGLLGVGATASAVVGAVAGVGRTFSANRPHTTRAGSRVVVAHGLTVAVLGLVLGLVARDDGLSERSMELAGVVVQLAAAATGTAAVVVMSVGTKSEQRPLTRRWILAIAGAAAVVALTCLLCATRLQPA